MQSPSLCNLEWCCRRILTNQRMLSFFHPTIFSRLNKLMVRWSEAGMLQCCDSLGSLHYPSPSPNYLIFNITPFPLTHSIIEKYSKFMNIHFIKVWIRVRVKKWQFSFYKWKHSIHSIFTGHEKSLKLFFKNILYIKEKNALTMV